MVGIEHCDNKNLIELISLLRESDRKDLLPLSDKSFSRGHYTDADMSWIIDHISSVRPLIDVMKLHVKGSQQNILSFMQQILANYKRISNRIIKSDQRYRLSSFTTDLKERFDIKHLSLTGEEEISFIGIIFNEPQRALVNNMIELINDFKLKYTISKIEFAYDISTDSIKYTYEAICRWLIKKNTNNAYRCFSHLDKKVIWASWKEHDTLDMIPDDASLYLDDRNSRSWIKAYIKTKDGLQRIRKDGLQRIRKDGLQRIRIELTATRQYLRESLKINTIEDLCSHNYSDIANSFSFVNYDIDRFIQLIINFVDKKRFHHGDASLPPKPRRLIQVYSKLKHDGLYMHHSLQGAILAQTKKLTCPKSCKNFNTCDLSCFGEDRCPKLIRKNLGPKITSSIINPNMFDSFFRECIKGIPILK